MADQYLSTAELDFDSLKSDFIKFLQNQNQFKDFNFEGSNLSTILDLLTYNTHINAFYLNQVGTESFLDTALLKESVVSHAKELNYLPRSRNSSRAIVNLSSTGNVDDGTKTINKFTTFTTTLGSNTLTFSTDRDVVAVNDGTGTFIANNVNIFEGTVVTEFFDVTSANTTVVVSSANVDVDSLEVVVQNSASDLANTPFTKAENLFELTPTSSAFFVQGFGTDKYEIQFGNDITGKRLTVGNIIRLRYRETLGDEGNNAKVFVSSDPTITTTTVSNSSLGSERESIDSIRFNAPRVFSTQDRAVTVEDYKSLIKNKFPTIQTLNVVGGEKLNPPRFGKVVVIPKPFNTTVASQSLKDSIVDFLKEKASISTEVITADPKFIILDIVSSVRYNSTQTSRTAEEIKTEVINKIISFGSTNLSEFDKDFRFSKLLGTIDSADTAILSNNTKVRLAKEISPASSDTNNFVLNFSNDIKRGSLTSTLFTKTINGVTFEASFEDNNGTVQLVSLSRGAKEIIDFDAGSIDYNTGEILLNQFKLDGYFTRGRAALGDRVQLFVEGTLPDVIVEQDQIIQIQTLNVSVNVTGQTTDD
tara:strand:+ start:5068 stop:6837 length:1770 start_codon:yes stop_codon:yes gene_type:complete